MSIQTLNPCFTTPWQYSVHFAKNVFAGQDSSLLDVLSRFGNDEHRVIFFIDDGVAEAWPQLPQDIRAWCESARSVNLVQKPQVLLAGEACKDGLFAVKKVLDVLSSNKIDRHSYVVAIGGGAFLDMVGFAASICHRGIRMIRMPSTVLSQNDAGIGVKNGVNYQGQKNFLGSFTVPIAVINDFQLLQTLERRDKRSGTAEAIKVALLKDAKFYTWIYQNRQALAEFDETAVSQLIYDCARLHIEQISQGGDPFETGNLRPLDFGHWVAHRLEILSDHRIRHGEAVAVGIALDLAYSIAIHHLSPAVLDDYYEICRVLGFDLCPDELFIEDNNKLAIFAGLEHFREHLGGDLSIPMLKDVGVVEDVNEIDEKLYQSLIGELKSVWCS